MRFDYKTHCLPADRLDAEGGEETAFGREGALNVVLVSSGRCGVEGADAPLLAGAGCLVASGAPLCLSPLGDCHLLGASLIGSAAAELAAQFEAPALLDTATCPTAPERLAELSARLPDSRASAIAYALVCELAEAQPGAEPLPKLVADAMEHIRLNYAEVYGVEELAGELGVSKSHLVRSFSAALGVTPGQYLTGVRVQAAKRLLLQPYPLEAVASLCGFSGANYLIKVFKKATGETPGAYRERLQPTAADRPERSEWEDMLFL